MLIHQSRFAVVETSAEAMLSVDQALTNVLDAFQRLPAELIPIADGLGRVLAQNVVSAQALPPFPNSSMDGYAVRAADVAHASNTTPIQLAIVGDIPAGVVPSLTVGAGQAARIMTGAMMPDGADTVVPIEQTDHASFRSGDAPAAPLITVNILKGSRAGDYVRPVGEDIAAGAVVLRSGRVLRAADLGVLAGLGITQIEVIRRPLVAVLSTGDELLTADQPLEAGKIRDMNGYTITALAQGLGARAVFLGIARDTDADVRAKLQQAVDMHADVIISTAGVSVGAFDVVKSVIESMGSLGFWKVNMRPGKPLAFGAVQSIPFLGLPGNPVSAMVSFEVFARPAILKLAGKAYQADMSEAELAEPMQSDGRRTYMRVTLERNSGSLIAHSTGTQSSGALSSLVAADGLMIIPEGVTDIPAGTRLAVRVFAD
jgi:molybdopterin molybdotransferase